MPLNLLRAPGQLAGEQLQNASYSVPSFAKNIDDLHSQKTKFLSHLTTKQDSTGPMLVHSVTCVFHVT